MNMKKPSSPLHWLRIYKLYLQAFPRYERKPFAVIRSMYKKGSTDIWYFEKDGRFGAVNGSIVRKDGVSYLDTWVRMTGWVDTAEKIED